VTSEPVIVSVDGDATARDAVALGRRLAALLEAPLDIVTVSAASPAEALAEVADAERAAMIVLGPTHRHALARPLRGTARRLLPEAPCPVAIAPAGYADRAGSPPIRRIGAGFEASPEAREALVTAHRLAGRAGGDLRAIGVVLPLGPLAIDDLRDRTPYLDEERRIVHAALEHALAELPAGVPSVADARIGDPAVELADASAGLDLLVCGSRRRDPLRVALLGSVTERLLRTAVCPVLIVPRPGDANRQARERRRGRRGSTIVPPPG
jgi:nucleotide-binding universal stress UspA family protein